MREAAKTSASSSGKIYKYQYLTGEEILPPDQRRVIEQVKFAYSSQEKLLKNKQKQLKNKEKVRQMLLQINTKEQSL